MASSNNEYDRSNWKNKLPIGFRFVPTDKELNMYLKLKSCNGNIPPGIFSDVDIYQYEPQQLSGFAEKHWDGRMYFFTPLRKKHGSGSGSKSERIIHSGKGVWKATQARKDLSKNACESSSSFLFANKEVNGTKTSLVYCEFESGSKNSSSKKTSWLMSEYRFPIKIDPPPLFNGTNDELTLCVIYYHATKKDNDDQIAMLIESNDPIPQQSPINQNFGHSPYTSHQEVNPYSYPNFVPSFTQIQQYQPLVTTSSSGKKWSVEHYYTHDIATTSTMQPGFSQLPQSYTSNVPNTSTMQISFPDQLPYGFMENHDIFSSTSRLPYDFDGFDESTSQYLNLDNVHYYLDDEEIGHIPKSEVDFIDHNKLETCAAPISQADQGPSSDSQDHDYHQQLKMKKIKI